MQPETAKGQTFEVVDGSRDLPWLEPDMSVVDGGRRAAPALPIRVFGAWVQWIEAHAEGRSAPVDYVALGLLASASTLIGNSRWVSPWSEWKEPPSLWIALVGNPSSGKSPALDASIDLLRKLEAEMADDFSSVVRQYQRDKEEAKVLKEAWQSEVKDAVKSKKPPPNMPERAEDPIPPSRPRLYVSDTTVEALGKLLAAHPRGLLFQRDELAGWLGSFDRYGGFGSDRAFWVEAYGGRSFVIDRVKHDNDPIRIPNLSIAVIGGIQPDRLSTLLMKGDDDGLASRFMMSWPQPRKPVRPSLVADDGAALSAFRRLHGLRMGQTDTGDTAPIVVPLSEEAASLFQEWRAENAGAEEEASGLYLSHIGKTPGMVLRLALTLEYLEWATSNVPTEPECIGIRSLGFAAHLVDKYFKPMALRVYGDASLPEPERHAAVLARRILKDGPDTVNIREVYREWKVPDLRESQKVKNALCVLEDVHWLPPNLTSNNPAGGRPRGDYSVNPRVYEGHS